MLLQAATELCDVFSEFNSLLSWNIPFHPHTSTCWPMNCRTSCFVSTSLPVCILCVSMMSLTMSISFSIVIENFINNEIQFVYFNLLCSSTVVPSGTVHKMVKTGLLTAWTWMKMDVVPVHGGFNLKSKKSVPDECILPASVMSLSTQQTPDTPLSLNCSTPVSLRYPG